MTRSAAKRLGFFLLTAMLATCCFLLTLAALVGLFYGDKLVFFIPLAYPAYVFFKWTRAASRRVVSTLAS
jgi:hypothetical protein